MTPFEADLTDLARSALFSKGFPAHVHRSSTPLRPPAPCLAAALPLPSSPMTWKPWHFLVVAIALLVAEFVQ
jgi:hypothetical protein